MEARENNAVGSLVRPVIVSALLFMVVCGLVYPLAATKVAQVLFPMRADGSLIESDGEVVGSALLGQQFTEPRYFHPRPSVTVATDGSGESVPYNAAQSAGSNYGPTNEELIAEVRQRVEDYRVENGLPDDALVPVDAVTASGSGLDPHITPANAQLQVVRVAEARRISEDEVRALVAENTDGRFLGFVGEPGVNVLELNLALDESGG